MSIQFHKGTTRYVLLVSNYAIKFPSFCSWKLFLTGLLCNLQEHTFGRCGFPELANVYWMCPGGWFLIQERVRPIHHIGLFWLHLERMIKDSQLAEEFLRSDVKYSNFGYRGSQLVKLDYGQ